MALESKHPERIVGAGKLDGPLVAISRRPAVFPLQTAATEGEAVIEFLIDTGGHARLPRVVSASDPVFGYSAVQAVGTWLFAAPLSQGKPMVARVQVPLKFKVVPPKSAAKASSTPQVPPAGEVGRPGEGSAPAETK